MHRVNIYIYIIDYDSPYYRVMPAHVTHHIHSGVYVSFLLVSSAKTFQSSLMCNVMYERARIFLLCSHVCSRVGFLEGGVI